MLNKKISLFVKILLKKSLFRVITAVQTDDAVRRTCSHEKLDRVKGKAAHRPNPLTQEPLVVPYHVNHLPFQAQNFDELRVTSRAHEGQRIVTRHCGHRAPLHAERSQTRVTPQVPKLEVPTYAAADDFPPRFEKARVNHPAVVLKEAQNAVVRPQVEQPQAAVAVTTQNHVGVEARVTIPSPPNSPTSVTSSSPQIVVVVVHSCQAR